MTDEQIFHGLIAKDRRTWAYIVKEFAPPILALVKFRGGTHKQGEDVFQEACIRLHLIIERGRYNPENKFAAYFLRIAKYVWIDTIRHNKMSIKHEHNAAVEEDIHNDAHAVSPDDPYEATHFARVFMDPDKYAFFQLWESWEDTECYERLERFHIEELSAKQIAQLEGLTDEEKIAQAITGGSTYDKEVEKIEGTIRQRLKRCRDKFRRMFQKKTGKSKP